MVETAVHVAVSVEREVEAVVETGAHVAVAVEEFLWKSKIGNLEQYKTSQYMCK